MHYGFFDEDNREYVIERPDVPASWTNYLGVKTAAWFYTAATKYILGIKLLYDGLTVDPCIPSEWQGFELVSKWRGAVYNIKVTIPDGVMKGVKSITQNGERILHQTPALGEGTVNSVEVIMGDKT